MTHHLGYGRVFDEEWPTGAEVELWETPAPTPIWEYLELTGEWLDAHFNDLDPETDASFQQEGAGAREELRVQAGLDLSNPVVLHAFGVALQLCLEAAERVDDEDTAEIITSVAYLYHSALKGVMRESE